MKQSILKKTSHFFCDGDSSIASVNTGSNITIARTSDAAADNNHVKNVRFLGVDMVQQLPASGNPLGVESESSLDYINFQRLTTAATNSSGGSGSGNGSASACPSPRPRKPKTSLTLKTWNMFGNDKFDDDDLNSSGGYGTALTTSQKPAVVYSSNNFLNVSFQLKSQPQNSHAQQQQQQQQQPSQQMHHVQHELLRKTLRICSASLENRSNRHGETTPTPSIRQLTPSQQQFAYDYSSATERVWSSDQKSPFFQSQSALSFTHYPFRGFRKSFQTNSQTHPSTPPQQQQQQSTNIEQTSNTSIAPETKSSSTTTSSNLLPDQQEQQVQQQSSQTPSSSTLTRPKARINSASSTSTSLSSGITTSAIYFPSSSQYFNLPTRVTSANSAQRPSSSSFSSNNGNAANNHQQQQQQHQQQLSGNGNRVAMTTNLALYTYLLQANRSLAKEMRASVIRSHTKNTTTAENTVITDNNIVEDEASNNSSSSNSSKSNQASTANNNNISSTNSNGNKQTSAQSGIFPGIQERKQPTQPQPPPLYRSSTSLKTRVAPNRTTNGRTNSAIVRNHSATYRRYNLGLINSKFNN